MPADTVVSTKPTTLALSSVSFAIAFPSFPSLDLEKTASPWFKFSKASAANPFILFAICPGKLLFKSNNASVNP